METALMHLCVPDPKKMMNDNLIVPSECSCNALEIQQNAKHRRNCAYHFPICESQNVVVIRNNPPSFSLQDIRRIRAWIRSLHIGLVPITLQYECLIVTLTSPDDAEDLAIEINATQMLQRSLVNQFFILHSSLQRDGDPCLGSTPKNLPHNSGLSSRVTVTLTLPLPLPHP